VLKRILITIAVIAISWAFQQLTLPGIDKQYLQLVGRVETLSVLALGLRPLILAFVFVELLSFVIPPGRRLRRSGVDGRRRLNQLSLLVGVILAALQAAGIAFALSAQGLTSVPGFSFLLISIPTLVAGVLVALLLATMITRWGIGNGVCLFICLPFILSFSAGIYERAALDRIFVSNIEPLIFIATVAILVWCFARRPTVEWISPGGNPISAPAPAFPQGAEPIVFTVGVFTWISSLAMVGWPLLWSNSVALPLAVALLLASSFVTFHLFSSRNRLFSNLPEGAVNENSGRPLRARMLMTAVMFVAVWILHTIDEPMLSFVGITILVAFGFDLAGEIRFRLKYGDDVASVLEMDNVYGATYLSAILAEAGIDSTIRAFHFRSLMFFFEPIVKMELLVPAGKVTQAQELIQSAAPRIV
jgi:hypothetical protein